MAVSVAKSAAVSIEKTVGFPWAVVLPIILQIVKCWLENREKKAEKLKKRAERRAKRDRRRVEKLVRRELGKAGESNGTYEVTALTNEIFNWASDATPEQVEAVVMEAQAA